MSSSKKRVDEWVHFARGVQGDYRPAGVGIDPGVNATDRFVSAAKVCRHPKPVVKVAGERGIPSVSVDVEAVAAEMHVLITAKHLCLGIILRHQWKCEEAHKNYKPQYL